MRSDVVDMCCWTEGKLWKDCKSAFDFSISLETVLAASESWRTQDRLLLLCGFG